MDIKQATTYFRQKDGWMGIYALLILTNLLMGIPIVGIVIGLFPLGYLYTLQNHRIFNTSDPLPKVDVPNILKTGVVAAVFSFVLIFIFAIAIGMFLMTISKDASMMLVAIILLTLFIAVVSVVFDILSLCFSTNLKASSLFKFKAIKLILVKYRSEYIELCVKKAAAFIVVLLLMMLTSFTFVVPIIIAQSLTFIFADLNAQFLRKIFKIKGR